MRVTIEFDTDSRAARVLLGLAVVALPVIAIAGSVDIPHTFSAGDPVSARQINENFSALRTGINDNDARIGVVTADVGTLSSDVDTVTADVVALAAEVADNTAAVDHQSCIWETEYVTDQLAHNVACAATDYAVSGYCIRTALNQTATLTSSGPDGVLIIGGDGQRDPTVSTGWRCTFDGSTNIYVGALCCPRP